MTALTLHHSAIIDADFPVLMPSLNIMVGPAKELTDWLYEQLTSRGIECGQPEDIEYAHELPCTVDGHIFTLMLSVDFAEEPSPFQLSIHPPQESWWQRRRRGRLEPIWKPAACELAEVIHECLTASDQIRSVTWVRDFFPVCPQPTYDTPTTDVAATTPTIRWWNKLMLFHTKMNVALIPLGVTVIVSTLATVIHPAFGLICLPAWGCAVVWFCIQFAGFGLAMLIGGIEGWQRGNENGQLLWNRGIALILIPAGVLVAGYALVLPLLILREFLNR